MRVETPSTASLHAALRARADPINAAGARRYFPDGVKTYGVHRPVLDRMARDAAAALKLKGGLPAALRIADGLYRSGNMDEAALAARIVARFGRAMVPAHFEVFDRWVGWLNDWASCDSLCTQVIGPLERLLEVFALADRLLGDPDPMVQKAVGWLLKEATKRAGEVVRYLIANRNRTTRLVLRYASEKLPPGQRLRVLTTA